MNDLMSRIAKLERDIRSLRAREGPYNRLKYPLGRGNPVEIDFNDSAGYAGRGWDFATAAPFSPPNLGADYAYLNDYLSAAANTGKFFYRKFIAGTTYLNQFITARVGLQHGASIGVRVDTANADVDYASVYFIHTGGMTVEVRLKQSTASVVTTTTLATIRGDPFATIAMYLYSTSAPSWTPYVYIVQEDGMLMGIGSGAAVTWVPTRVGVIFREDVSGSNFGSARCDWVKADGFV